MINILVLRSYGDYIILLNTIRYTTIKKPIKLYVSNHLFDLHKSINPVLPDNIECLFIDLKIRSGILGFFTNKHFFSIQSFKEITALKRFLNMHSSQDFYLEQKKRSNFLSIIIGKKFEKICNNKNVYQEYNNFFNSHKSKIENNFSDIRSNFNILIFPDSRKSNKVINPSILNKIEQILQRKKIHFKIANFNKKYESNIQKRFCNYSNFDELINLIKSGKFIISSDSLPAHIAEYLEIPHWILYHNKINYNWITPSSLEGNTFGTFNELDLLNNLLD